MLYEVGVSIMVFGLLSLVPPLLGNYNRDVISVFVHELVNKTRFYFLRQRVTVLFSHQMIRNGDIDEVLYIINIHIHNIQIHFTISSSFQL